MFYVGGAESLDGAIGSSGQKPLGSLSLGIETAAGANLQVSWSSNRRPVAVENGPGRVCHRVGVSCVSPANLNTDVDFPPTAEEQLDLGQRDLAGDRCA